MSLSQDLVIHQEALETLEKSKAAMMVVLDLPLEPMLRCQGRMALEVTKVDILAMRRCPLQLVVHRKGQEVSVENKVVVALTGTRRVMLATIKFPPKGVQHREWTGIKTREPGGIHRLAATTTPPEERQVASMAKKSSQEEEAHLQDRRH